MEECKLPEPVPEPESGELPFPEPPTSSSAPPPTPTGGVQKQLMEGATWLVDEVGSLQEELLNGGAARKLSEVLEGAVDEGIGLVQATVETVEEEVKRVEEDLRWWKRVFRKKQKKVAKRLERGQKRYHHSHDRLRVPLLLGTLWVILQRVLNSKSCAPTFLERTSVGITWPFGHYCGPANGQDHTLPPRDPLDAMCAQHDYCIEHSLYPVPAGVGGGAAAAAAGGGGGAAAPQLRLLYPKGAPLDAETHPGEGAAVKCGMPLRAWQHNRAYGEIIVRCDQQLADSLRFGFRCDDPTLPRSPFCDDGRAASASASASAVEEDGDGMRRGQTPRPREAKQRRGLQHHSSSTPWWRWYSLASAHNGTHAAGAAAANYRSFVGSAACGAYPEWYNPLRHLCRFMAMATRRFEERKIRQIHATLRQRPAAAPISAAHPPPPPPPHSAAKAAAKGGEVLPAAAASRASAPPLKKQRGRSHKEVTKSSPRRPPPSSPPSPPSPDAADAAASRAQSELDASGDASRRRQRRRGGPGEATAGAEGPRPTNGKNAKQKGKRHGQGRESKRRQRASSKARRGQGGESHFSTTTTTTTRRRTGVGVADGEL